MTDKTLPDPLRQGIRAQASSALLAKMPVRSHGHPGDQEKARTSLRPRVLLRLPLTLGQKEPKIQEVRHLFKTRD